MRTIAYAVLTCMFLSGTAVADQAALKAKKLGNIYTFYLKAENCAEHGIAFETDDIAKLTAAVNQYADASGVPQIQRDKEWEIAKKAGGRVATDQEWCDATRNSLSYAFPGVLSFTDDNPV
jgi:hypothetical protein